MNEEQQSSQKSAAENLAVLVLIAGLIGSLVLFTIKGQGSFLAGKSYPYRPLAVVSAIATIALAVSLKRRIIKVPTLPRMSIRGQTTEQFSDVVVNPASRTGPVAKRNLLFDIKFNRFFTPIIVSVLYVICQVLITLGTFVLWIVYVRDFTIDSSSGFVVLTMLWTAPVFLFAALLVILLLRLTFESIIVRFRIAEDLRHIRDK